MSSLGGTITGCEAGGGCVCLLSHVSVTDPIISARMTEFVTEVWGGNIVDSNSRSSTQALPTVTMKVDISQKYDRPLHCVRLKNKAPALIAWRRGNGHNSAYWLSRPTGLHCVLWWKLFSRVEVLCSLLCQCTNMCTNIRHISPISSLC